MPILRSFVTRHTRVRVTEEISCYLALQLGHILFLKQVHLNKSRLMKFKNVLHTASCTLSIAFWYNVL